ncbi:matrixin family metalloprotease [Nocardioides jiangxiensis]|uniref:Matrixin family metalloprotease n=1 Tax=Nocardioides jiangxiensis TaxID=3064524 RepID=A0ABT9B8A5_9ACTN|nr:matrixin family metalloprotease [Nocardioides sp. WY-20]MDO7869373.1 matrixin family metalloprotease [Nocardioides sp. WY-20]
MKRSALALAACLPLVSGLLLQAPAHAATSTTVTATLSSSTVKVGSTTTISGTASGPAGRDVRLDVRIASGWRTLTTSTTSSTGAYRMAAPSQWIGGHDLRVVAPASGDAASGWTGARTLTVKPGWTPSGSSSDWRWLATDGDHPRYNPCRAITWKFNRNGGYAASLDDVQGAFRRLAQATGLTFAYKGTTSVVPASGQYDRSVAITVGFVSSLSGTVAGRGGGTWSIHDGYEEMLHGTLALDRSEHLRTGFTTSGEATWGQIMEHELGHVLGLGHAAGSSQLMYGSATSRNHLMGAGDLSAFRAVGLQAGCIPHAQRTV